MFGSTADSDANSELVYEAWGRGQGGGGHRTTDRFPRQANHRNAVDGIQRNERSPVAPSGSLKAAKVSGINKTSHGLQHSLELLQKSRNSE